MSAQRSRLVLLEDNEAVRRATELSLTLEDFQVTSVGSAAEVERVLGSPRGDEILLADFRLDGSRTGLDVLRDLRRRTGQKIPAVIMSGDLTTVMDSIKEPVPHCMFLNKPINIKKLIAIIGELSGIRE
jgi:DNA-binding NtrC family response regulator